MSISAAGGRSKPEIMLSFDFLIPINGPFKVLVYLVSLKSYSRQLLWLKNGHLGQNEGVLGDFAPLNGAC
jgi:hypothetical protein